MRSRRPIASLSLISRLLLLAPWPSSAFYLPGVAPTTYREGDKVPLLVNRLFPGDSDKDMTLHSAVSYDYYAPELHFCQPEEGPKWISESLGSILFGDRIQTSPFDLRMMKNETCRTACADVKYSPDDAKWVNKRILSNYELNWLIDGLPAAQALIDQNSGEIFYSPGFALGDIMGDIEESGEDNAQPVMNNHYEIIVDYHMVGKDGYRVVGVRVDPISMRDSTSEECGDPDVPLELSEESETSATFTYSVYWVPSATTFATRWDRILHVYDPKIHWFSIVNSAVIVVFLVVMVTSILIRTLRKDIARYNRLDNQVALDDFSGNGAIEDGVQEDSGWKLVHGDVFRPPKHALFLSILVGNGTQLFMMAGFTIALALFGFLSPSNRGLLTTVMLLLYILFSFLNGYASSRVYKFFNGQAWKTLFASTPLALPGLVFATFFFLNLFVWARGASGAVPFTTMLVLILMWFIISVPLSLVGSWLGFKQPVITPPTRTNQIPRQVPPSGGYLKPLPSMLLVGILPFGAMFVELYFIMNSIWFNKVYYMFGFLFLCYGLMVITCSSLTILMIYFLLCAENYRWQWRAFFTSGACSVYVFGYALLYWMRTLSFASWTGGVIYLGYSLLISVLVFVLTGEYCIALSIERARTDIINRHNRIHGELVVRNEDLQLHQGGLAVAGGQAVISCYPP